MNCCTAFIPLLRKGGRVVNVSSGGGLANTQRMGEGRREWLLRRELTMDELQEAVKTFIRLYEQAAPGGDLPKLAEEGWWLHVSRYSSHLPRLISRLYCLFNSFFLWRSVASRFTDPLMQAYGFSKAALNAYTRILAREVRSDCESVFDYADSNNISLKP